MMQRRKGRANAKKKKRKKIPFTQYPILSILQLRKASGFFFKTLTKISQDEISHFKDYYQEKIFDALLDPKTQHISSLNRRMENLEKISHALYAKYYYLICKVAKDNWKQYIDFAFSYFERNIYKSTPTLKEILGKKILSEWYTRVAEEQKSQQSLSDTERERQSEYAIETILKHRNDIKDKEELLKKFPSLAGNFVFSK